MKLKFVKTVALAFVMVCSMSICQPAFATSADTPMPINSSVEATSSTAPTETPLATEEDTADGQGSVSFSGNGVVTADSAETPVEEPVEPTTENITTENNTEENVSVYVEGFDETVEATEDVIPVDDSDLATVDMETGEITSGVTDSAETPQQTESAVTTEAGSSSGNMTILVAVTGVMLGIAVLVAGFVIVKAVFSKNKKEESDE